MLPALGFPCCVLFANQGPSIWNPSRFTYDKLLWILPTLGLHVVSCFPVRNLRWNPSWFTYDKLLWMLPTLGLACCVLFANMETFVVHIWKIVMNVANTWLACCVLLASWEPSIWKPSLFTYDKFLSSMPKSYLVDVVHGEAPERFS